MNAINTQMNDLQSRILATRAGFTEIPTHKVGYTPVNPTKTTGIDKASSQEVSFGDILQSKLNELKFSAHASARLKSRGIDMTPEVMSKLKDAVAGAEKKGSRDSLIIMSNLAFIVNIPNKTVVTAMDGESIKDNIFTNIDSTVIAS